jgi:nucleotide-binding universal stress UspA family protein
MFERILVPLDGYPLSEAMLPHVKVLAKGLGSQVTLLHAVEPVPLDYVDPELESYAAKASQFAHPLAESYLERMAQELTREGVKAGIKLIQGKAPEGILAYAVREDAGLVAMSTHSRSGPAQWILGSTADRILRSGERPVLLVRPCHDGVKGTALARLSSIVVPLDGSPTAEAILPFVQELARAMELKITLLHVINVETTVRFGEMNADTKLMPNEVLQRAAVLASDYLADVANRPELRGLCVQSEVLGGSPADRVVDFARETPDCLVAMTTHGRSGFRRWIVGSVADRVVRYTGEPVLAVCAHSSC